MKFSIERNSFLSCLAHVQNVVEQRPTVPILSNILITANSSKLILSATDMDLSIIENVDSSVIEEGSVTTPAHTLYDIVRKIPEGNEIELISNDGNKLSLRSGSSKFSLSCLPKDDFPKINQDVLENEFNLNSEDLKKIIDKTKFAVSNEETRYYLNGIYIHAIDENNEKKLRAVATDGHRLAKFETKLPQDANKIPGIIIPKKTINEVRKIIENYSGVIKISLDESKILFNVNNVTLSSKLIDGSFPDYEKVIPKNNDKSFSVDKKLIYEAVDRVSTVSSEKTRSIKLVVFENNISLSSSSAETGTGAEDIKIKYSGEKLEVGYNARYLMEIINQIDGDLITFELFDSSSPSIILDNTSKNSLYILMPMRV